MAHDLICDACEGTRREPCEACSGSGRDADGRTCSACSGSGCGAGPCPTCDGTGTLTDEVTDV